MQPTCSIAADKGKLLREGQLSISNSLPHRAQVFTSEQLVKLVKFIFKVPEQGSLFILKQVTHPSSIRDFRAAVLKKMLTSGPCMRPILLSSFKQLLLDFQEQEMTH